MNEKQTRTSTRETRQGQEEDAYEGRAEEAEASIGRRKEEQMDRAQDAKGRYKESHKQQLAERRKKWRSKFPERKRAHQAVSKAVRRGTLIRPSNCQECGIPCSPHAHHEDYSKRFDVEWLCHSCHEKRHPEKATLSKEAKKRVPPDPTKLFFHNTSGMRGVTFDRSVNQWRATATVDGKVIRLGSSKSKQVAVGIRAAFNDQQAQREPLPADAKDGER